MKDLSTLTQKYLEASINGSDSHAKGLQKQRLALFPKEWDDECLVTMNMQDQDAKEAAYERYALYENC